MRIILDVQDAFDADRALKLAKESLRNGGQEFGYWDEGDPSFTAFVRKTKTGVSVKAWRK